MPCNSSPGTNVATHSFVTSNGDSAAAKQKTRPFSAPEPCKILIVQNANPTTRAAGHPMWAGFNSGLNGNRLGQRTASAPVLFPLQAPSTSDLGIGAEEPDDTNWPLHAKPVPPLVDIFNLDKFVHSPDLRNATRAGLDWLQSDKSYGIGWPNLVQRQLPYASFTDNEMLTMLRVGKLRPLHAGEAIRAGVRAFPISQPSKQRKRPIFEPLLNSVIRREDLPPLHYLSRERRQKIVDAQYFLQFDFAGWYDQFPLHSDVQNCYVVRAKRPIEWEGATHTLFTDTSSNGSHMVRTHVTWAILEPIIRNPDIEVITMIDNVAIMSNNPDAFADAVQLFLERCRAFGATLNDAEAIPSSRIDIINAGKTGEDRHEQFLGEVYNSGCVRNTDNNVSKLRRAFSRLQASSEDETIYISRRNLAGLIGLLTFMAHTINISPRNMYEVVRTYSRISAMSTPWDDAITITPHIVNTLGNRANPNERPRTAPQATGPPITTDGAEPITCLSPRHNAARVQEMVDSPTHST
eukprot:PhM_4_TR16822/c1_g1_i1/m.47836